jgi:hypothetical protein
MRGVKYSTVDRVLTNCAIVNGCWVWQGKQRNVSGYAVINGLPAHRVIYQRIKQSVPRELQLDHLCRNRLCVNPDHLEPVTPLENKRRAALSRTHCIHGHEFTEANTYMYHGKRRGCRICRAAATKRIDTK